MIWRGCSGRHPTDAEVEFATLLEELLPGLDYWLHQDEDGTPWMCVSHDFVVDNHIFSTLRLDVDPTGMRGGWSPACLNWDDGVRADEADIDFASPDGICIPATDRSTAELVDAAKDWFTEHVRQWPESDKGRPALARAAQLSVTAHPARRSFLKWRR